MRRFTQIFLIISLGIIQFCQLNAQTSVSLNAEQKKKIDGRFGSLLNKEYPGLNLPEALPLIPSPTVENDVTYYDVIVYANNMDVVKKAGIKTGTGYNSWITAKATLGQIIALAQMPEVTSVKSSRVLKSNNRETIGEIGADILHNGFVNNTVYKGKNVLVGILDTGIDWKHGDFRDPNDPTKSRIVGIWDATLTKIGAEQTPGDKNANYLACCNYGVEYTQADINDELDGVPSNFVREKDLNGHGTHVAGTAAGNGASTSDKRNAGVAPEADLLIVKGGANGFSSSNIINGLEFFKKKAQDLGKPIAVNMSLGGHYTGHDGLDPIGVAANLFPATGRVVMIAAGNEGGDLIHVRKNVLDGASQTVNFTIPMYTATPGASNDYIDIIFYMDGTDPANFTITSPTNKTLVVASGQTAGQNTADGYLYGENGIDPDNGLRYFFVEVYDQVANNTPKAGNWSIKIDNPVGGPDGDLDTHGWIAGSNPFYPNITGSDNDYSVASPGVCANALTVGAYSHRLRFSNQANESLGSAGTNDDIAYFSSRGPTRLELQKPDIAAPGFWMLSSRSADATFDPQLVAAGGLHVFEVGTSMATPATTGAVALLLQQNPSLTGNDVKNLIKSNPMKDVYTGAANNNTWGAGKLDVFKAMSKLVDNGNPIDRKIIAYDQWNGVTNVALTGAQKASVRFTPDISGQVTGVFFHTFRTQAVTPLGLTGPIVVQICADNNGNPGNVLITKNFPNTMAFKYSWHFMSFNNQPITVTAGQDYHVVLSLANAGDNWGLNVDNNNVDLRSKVFENGAWTLQNGFDFRIRPVIGFGGNKPLPVQLTYFTGQWANTHVALKWETATEINANHFEVERKFSNEQEFKKIGEVDAKGGQNLKTAYGFNDPNVLSNVSPFIYYRLKNVDNDNSSTYSDIVTIANPLHDFPEGIYPNPAHDVVYVVTKAETEKNVRVFDATGKVVMERALSGKLGTLDINSLAPGQYFLKVNGGSSFKLIKN